MIIDTDNYAASGIETLVFPGGEPHVKVPLIQGKPAIIVHAKIRDWLGLGHLVLLLSALKNQQQQYTLFLPYFPGARQDRPEGGRCGATLEVVARMLQAEPRIRCFDPHSPETLKSLFQLGKFGWQNLAWKGTRRQIDGIIAPDEGAVERARKFRDTFYPELPVLLGTKERNPHTGLLSGYKISTPRHPGNFLIVDDICDGGGTFNLLVKSARQGSVAWQESTFELLVSHGIFSKGVGALDPRITHIHTTDSFYRPNVMEQLQLPVTVYKLLPELKERILANA